MEMPSQEEQIIAEKYVLERPLVRPDTDAKKAIKYSLMYVTITTILGCLILYLFDWLGVFALFPDKICDLKLNHPIWFDFIFFVFIFAFTAICCLKSAVIGCIRLYQHYAPEEIRRRCLFKPTCSEYAILAIKKNGLIIGLLKTYIRLFKKCRGNIYRIDYP